MLFQRPKRVAILRTGLELFAARGYERTSIAEIARCSGVTLDTFYKYFGSKEHLARVIYEDVDRERDCYLEVLPPENASLQQQFLLLWCRVADFAVQYPDAMRYLESYRDQLESEDEGFAIPSILIELVELLRRAELPRISRHWCSARSSGAPFCSCSSSTAAAIVHSRRTLFAHRVNAAWMPFLGHGALAPCQQWRAE